MRLNKTTISMLLSTTAALFILPDASFAQEQSSEVTSVATDEVPEGQEITVTGYRKSLESAAAAKREATNFTESISSQDIGKFPDLNLAESLQRLPGCRHKNWPNSRSLTISGLIWSVQVCSILLHHSRKPKANRMRFDGHQHFWNLANSFTDWPTPDLFRIYRDFGPSDLQEHLKSCEIDGTILVQAAPSVQETEYCLKIGKEWGFVKGVVGWIDFEAKDALAVIYRLAHDPLLKGLRPMVQSISESGWILDDRFTSIFQAMCEHGLRLDGLVLAHQIGDLDQLAKRHPDLAIILDHGGKPPIARNLFDDWARAIGSIARNPNVFCKLSGLWTEAGPDISQTCIQPWVDYLLASFGTRRLVWGSDWPVVELAGSYEDWFAQCRKMLAGLSEAEAADIFSHNGRRFYGLQ